MKCFVNFWLKLFNPIMNNKEIWLNVEIKLEIWFKHFDLEILETKPLKNDLN